jgi:ABC-type glycerol-3-phosphate transport system substrate-binding protein
MLLNGSWEVPTAVAAAQFRWDVVRAPRAPRTLSSSTLSSIQPGCIAGATTHPDESWRWLRYLLSPEAQARWNNGKVRIPALKSACSDPKSGYGVAPPADATEIVTALATSSDLHFTTNWQPFRAALLAALEPALNGDISLDIAVSNAIQAGNSALGP